MENEANGHLACSIPIPDVRRQFHPLPYPLAWCLMAYGCTELELAIKANEDEEIWPMSMIPMEYQRQ